MTDRGRITRTLARTHRGPDAEADAKEITTQFRAHKQKRESKRKYGKTLIRRDARGTEIETRRQARERM